MPHVAPKFLVPCAFGALFVSGIWLGRPPQDGETAVVAHPIAGPVHFIEGLGGNIGLSAGPDGVLVIDDQMKEVEPKVLAAIESISKSPWRFVLNTHFHPDHTGNNASFGRKAPILAHTNVRVRLMDPAGGAGAAAPEALPVITYEDGISIFLNGEEIRVRHYPGGHTDGDSVIFFTKSNVVHLGDLFFCGRFPFVDLDSGGSVRKLIENLDRIIPELKNDVKLVPGHGPLATLEDLKSYRAMLADCVQLVGAAAKAGKTVEQMKKERVLRKYEKLAWPFISEERFLDIVARDLGAK